MDKPVTRIVIVGGGTAGWLAACRIAAATMGSVTVTLIESPDVPTIGVGEGTWPTIRRTLERIGIGEAEVLLACDGSFKQGTCFDGWTTGADDDRYYHPFVPPIDVDPADLPGDRPFAFTACAQPQVCVENLAPRQPAMPDYGGALNYAYHLDAAKLATLLARHATTRLNVRHVRDHVVSVDRVESGDIGAVTTRQSGAIAGDLFLDCTGRRGLLIDETLGAELIDASSVLFNDRALAVQLPVTPDSPIASQTMATAHAAGWIWDIGLPTRRGIGCVYASAFMSDDQAEGVLIDYCRRIAPESPTPRRLSFRSAYRAQPWTANCLAIGQSAGFMEPLEASAIVMIELSLDALLDDFPVDRKVMAIQAQRFNALARYRWERIVDFLKLHYVLSQRDEPYWRAHRDPASIPDRLVEALVLWRHRAPSALDLPMQEELFPAASYRYILWGMGFPAPLPSPVRRTARPDLPNQLRQIDQRARALTASLPTNRAYLDALRAEQAPLAERTA
ncbi:tryptophan halogenase family protein [uncultured Sphingomonas sp.]|uniref:tryptophan halogenase family protein n=1 Tax=uncultured Sphingomonas sp. TaxID=158754 RepID=UPI0037479373